MTRAVFVVTVILGVMAGPAAAQRPAQAFPRWAPPALANGFSPADLRAVSRPDTNRVIVGYQPLRGFAIGAGVGTLVGLVLGAYAGGGECADCSSQPSRGRVMLVGGLVGAGAGGLLGFLVGLAEPRYAEEK